MYRNSSFQVQSNSTPELSYGQEMPKKVNGRIHKIIIWPKLNLWFVGLGENFTFMIDYSFFKL